MRIRNDPKLHWPRGVAHLRFYDPDQVPPRKSVSLKTESLEEAHEAAGRIKAAWHLGLYSPWDEHVAPPSMNEAINDFLVHKARSLKSTSMKSLREVLLRPDVYVSTTVDKYTVSQAEKALFSDGSRQTMKRRLITIKSFFRWLVRTDVIESHPVLKIKTPRVYRSPPRYLSRQQITDLYTVLEGEERMWMKRAIILGLGTGIRASSLLALRGNDAVRLQGGAYGLNVWHDTAKTDGYVAAVLGRARGLVEAIMDQDDAERQRLIVCFDDGSAIPVDRLSAEFSKIRDQLGWAQPLTFHSLRHTFASHLVLEGVDIYTLKDLLGHKSVATTERYAHLVSHRSLSIANNINIM